MRRVFADFWIWCYTMEWRDEENGYQADCNGCRFYRCYFCADSDRESDLQASGEKKQCGASSFFPERYQSFYHCDDDLCARAAV